ncbi:MAG: hypothetical protein E7478_01720 [Ruminococcaceae bacterium]|nr:hypothetical protein [Oscillospiraceae bacterium]
MLTASKLGNSDRPVSSCIGDEFQIRPYIEGLAEFIKDCETPMTVAVQGDWGCGKTSMMNMVRDYLNPDNKEDDIVDVWFNTWQFSQFNMDDTLAVTFLQHLLNELIKNIAHDKEVKDNLVPKMKRVLKTLAVNVTSLALGDNAANLVGAIGDELTPEESELDAAAKIMELKSTFHDIIGKVNKRVVVYIDDLDRLQPVRAVELLEVLKLFVDCENCVFVMAIDTSVVFQGIREKYGSDMSQAKAQSFFDKMIQLPFKMPVAYYRLDGMIERLLTFMQDNTIIKDANERREFISLLKSTAGGNPRSLKRLVNSVMLIDKVAVKKGIYSEQLTPDKPLKVQILVALSCLQHRFNEVYDFIVGNITPRSVNQLSIIVIPDKTKTERCEILLQKLYELGMPQYSEGEPDDPAALYELMSFFISRLKKYFDNSRAKGINDINIYWQLVNIISLNNITEAEPAAGGNMPEPLAQVAPETQTDAVSSDDVLGNTRTGMELFAAEIKALCDSGNEGKQEAQRRLYNAGYYCDCFVDYTATKTEFRSIPLVEMQSSLREWYNVKETPTDMAMSCRIDSGDFNGFRMDITCVYFSKLTQIDICFGGLNTPLHHLPIAERVHEFVRRIRGYHQEAQQIFGGKIIGDDYISGLRECCDDDGNIGYGKMDRCLLRFTVFSDEVTQAIIQLAIEIANDPSLVQGKDQAAE